MAMKALNLCLHAGGKEVTRGRLFDVGTPEPTRIWRPIPHATLLTGVQSALVAAGYELVAEAHALARDGQRYFGMLQLNNHTSGHFPNVTPDYSLVVGLRNSHDQRFPAGLVVGSGVFVCDNLAFSGEVKIARKHTTNIIRDLPGLIDSAVGRLADVRGHQDQRIEAYKGFEMADAQAHDLLVQALDARVCGPTMIPDVLKEWRTPRHPEFAQAKTGWRLFNAFTEALKDRALFDRPRATQALHGLMDTACGVAALN